MHLHYRITTLLASVLLIAPNASANSWGVKNAYCKDYADPTFGSISRYEWQIKYEYCMKNADRLIRERNELIERLDREREERSRKSRIEAEKKRKQKEQEEARRRQEQERIQREDRMRFEQQLNNFDDYFR